MEFIIILAGILSANVITYLSKKVFTNKKDHRVKNLKKEISKTEKKLEK